MADRKGDKDKSCEIEGCPADSERSVSAKKVADSGLEISKRSGKVHLCKDHYKEFKKKTKKDRELQRLGW